MPEAIIDLSAGYFDKISLFFYANLEELFVSGGKREQKKTLQTKKVLLPPRVSPSQR